jgi:protein-tyrosine-phosphatase
MKTKCLMIVFVLSFAVFACSAFACENPGIRTSAGVPVNPFGGILIIDGSTYADSQITYALGAFNNNNQGLQVSLNPETAIEDYFQPASALVEKNTVGSIPVTVWVGGQSVSGKVDVNYQCEDGSGQYLTTYFFVVIIGKGQDPPPTSDCHSRNLNGCYQGMIRTYSCASGQLTYQTACSNYCCQQFGGKEATCSNDRSTCFSLNNLPPPTEGKIAFACKDDKCSYNSEPSVRYMLRILGWDVTAKAYNKWTQAELANYDIIACSDESTACKLKFNSPLYNSHVEGGKPFLEIPDSSYVNAALAFEYLTKQNAKAALTRTGNDITFSADYITQDYTTAKLSYASSYLTVDKTYLTADTKDLGDFNGQSVMFKANDAANHGRYAFLGWMYKAGYSSMTPDGETILKNTLKWLKLGDAGFGGTNYNIASIGKIAFVCGKDDCSNIAEMNLIKFLRKSNYAVDGKSGLAWTTADLSNYDLIVCADENTACNVKFGSTIYNMHKISGKGFLEIASGPRATAANVFGYISADRTSTSSAEVLKFSDGNGFVPGSGNLRIYDKARSTAGIKTDFLKATDIAHPYPNRKDSGLSTLYNSQASGTAGRYFYVGFLSSNKITDLNDVGRALLLRAVEWTRGGGLPTFDLLTNKVPITITINSPQNVTYATRKIDISIQTSRPASTLYMAKAAGAASKLCTNCNSYAVSQYFNIGTTKISITAEDENWNQYFNSVYFTVKT